MIKYIVDTTSSERDLNGNTYHFARITSTKTGNSLVVDQVGGSGNATGLLFRLKVANDWSDIHATQRWERKREWQRMAKHASGSTKLYEHDITAKMLRALNRKAS